MATFNLHDVDPVLRPQITEIVDACRVTPQQAYESLLLHGFSVEDSIRALHQASQKSAVPVSSSLNRNGRTGDPGPLDYGSLDDSDEEYEPYFYYQMGEGANRYFYEKYPVSLNLLKSWHRSIQGGHIQLNRSNRGDDFLMEEFTEIIKDYQCIPGNTVQTLQEALCVSYTSSIPVLLLYTDFCRDIIKTVEELFSTPSLKQTLQSQFIYYGILHQHYIIEKWIRPILNIAQTLNSILIIRVNIFDEIEIHTKISLHQGPQDILDAIKKGKAATARKSLDEKYIRYKHQMSKEGHSWRRPLSFEAKSRKRQEQRKLFSNQRIRKQQEEAYRELAAVARKEEHVKNQQQQQEHIQYTKYLESLVERRKNIQTYTQGFQFKIRVPSGKYLYVTVPQTETVEYLYNTIECQEEDLGFENQCPRKFDVCVGLGPGESLSDRRGETIGTVFDQGCFLVVREVE